MNIIPTAGRGGGHTKEIGRYILNCCLIRPIGWVSSQLQMPARAKIYRVLTRQDIYDRIKMSLSRARTPRRRTTRKSYARGPFPPVYPSVIFLSTLIGAEWYRTREKRTYDISGMLEGKYDTLDAYSSDVGGE